MSDFLFGDPLPGAPALAPRGPRRVGVRHLGIVDPGRIDILAWSPETPEPRYDRRLPLEVWYPARLGGERSERVVYHGLLGIGPDDPERPTGPMPFFGRAARDAAPDRTGAPYPLVVVSHGFPGSRLMMSYLTENLASKGYLVVAADHTDSTYDRHQGMFASTLLNRALDQLAVLRAAADLGATPGHPLEGMVDADRSAVVGYSMGGYGAINATGGGIAEAAVDAPGGVPGGWLALRQAGRPEYEATLDPRLKAIVALAPWGGETGMFDAAGLAGVRVPSLFVAGDADDVSGYRAGVRRLWCDCVNSDRWLLVFENARHNIGPNPPPPAARVSWPEFERYAEPVWDERIVNNVNQHVITAFLDLHLKGDASRRTYLDVPVVRAADGVIDLAPDGRPGPDHSYWPGFTPRTAIGLQLWHLGPGETEAPPA